MKHKIDLNPGNEEKTINKSNSSKFFDVPDDIHDDNDNDNEEEEYSSMENPNSDSKDPQVNFKDYYCFNQILMGRCLSLCS